MNPGISATRCKDSNRGSGQLLQDNLDLGLNRGGVLLSLKSPVTVPSYPMIALIRTLHPQTSVKLPQRPAPKAASAIGKET